MLLNLLAMLLCFSMMTPNCFGYVDPGTGHLLWQSLFAALAGSLFVLRRILGLPTNRNNELRREK